LPVDDAGTGVLKINDVLAYPHPYCVSFSDSLIINYSITRPCDSVKLKIYTNAFRLIFEQAAGAESSAGQKNMAVPSSRLKAFSSGTYFMVLEATSGGEKARSKLTYLIILR
jgi:hypothetical protein